MLDDDKPRKKPRLFLRFFTVLILIAGIITALGYTKYGQIQTMMAQGSVPPPPISVTVAKASAEQWSRRIKAIGTLVASQGVDVASEVGGIVRMINFESGQTVKAGTLLIQLDNQTEIASLNSAQARYESDNSQYQRLLKLKNQSFVTKNDLDTQAGLVDVAKSQIGVARAALEKKSITAAFSGKLGIRQVDLGEYIAPGTPIVSLQAVDSLLLDFTLPESNFKDLAVGQTIEFKVRSYSDRVFKALIKAWNPELDSNTRNVSVQAAVDNRNGLLAPGMFAEMDVTGNRKISVLSLPETSIFYNIYGEAVYVLETDDSADNDLAPVYRLAARQVEVAYRDNGKVGILKGIKEGELVVTAGQLKLYPSLRVTIVDDITETAQSQVKE
ncbi:MAG: efflux RND transporter periplasmic adaptor subunit [Gammaproteobacteria bacterium]|nr:efflux RND transporter periplasmic adaptor subunit [Gammaproteobacteria bacterium]